MWKAIVKLVEKWSCNHKWEVHKEICKYNQMADTMPYQTRQTLICTECGKIKQITL